MHPDGDSKLPYTPLPRSLTDDLRDDPARFLDGPLDPFPRIRGLSCIREVRGWMAAERLLANKNDREPRDRIMAALASREQEIRESAGVGPEEKVSGDLGDYPEPEPMTVTLGITPDVLRDVYGPPDPGGLPRITPSSEPTWDEDRDDSFVSYEWDPDAVRERLLAEQEAENAHEQPVAADGGEDVGE